MSWYFLAFFTISMAMFGMTAGALALYFLDRHFPRERFFERLSFLSGAYALALILSWIMLITTVANFEPESPLLSTIVLIKLIVVLIPPYVAGGLIVSLALTRSPFPIGTTYAVDLIGAASGCFLVLGLMEVFDGVSALLSIAALGAVGALFFRIAEVAEARRLNPGERISAAVYASPVMLAVAILFIAGVNADIYPGGVRIAALKGQMQNLDRTDGIYWNSFSRVDIGSAEETRPFLWGPSPRFAREWTTPISQRWMRIDGDAGTTLDRFDGGRDELGFLEYDVTTLAYRIRNAGKAAVIGVGGGRDVLSAYHFGFDDITGIDINPIFIENLARRYAGFNRLAALPGVALHVDEARSWFARTPERFDLIQMSLIDTWAATGVGAYSLTENGLYTVEAWEIFLGRLTDTGVYTVSRWYSPDNPGETGRLIALAKAALYNLGAEDPNRHLYLASVGRLATLVVARAPLTGDELAALARTSREMQYRPLLEPGAASANPVIRSVQGAGSLAELYELSAADVLDYSPPTDSRPFFFNQLRLADLPGFLLGRHEFTAGVAGGNVLANLVLAIIIVVSFVTVMATIVVPTLPVLARVPARLALLGSSYFFLIGVGFMFVEIGLMQRLSVFLGHPVYGLAIALAGIILSTGLGSALSERMRLTTGARLAVWSLLTAAYIGALPFWFPSLVGALTGAGLLVRGAVSLAVIVPAGLVMGFAFPTGMRLASAVDTRPTPWFWAVNGAAGVFASGLAIGIGTFVSIDATLWAGAVAYLLLLPVAAGIGAMRPIPAAAEAVAA
ncbi:MAG: hypothetical protein ACE5EU_08165 [Paracoccaceae bacterium]